MRLLHVKWQNICTWNTTAEFSLPTSWMGEEVNNHIPLHILLLLQTSGLKTPNLPCCSLYRNYT